MIHFMGSILRLWLLVTAVFEVIALTRVFGLGHRLSEVMPLHGQPASPDFVFAWGLIAAMLACVRLGQSATIRSKGAWFITASVHTVELFYYTFISFTRETVLPRDFKDFSLQKHGEAAFIYAVIIFNASLFSFMWMITPSRTGQTPPQPARHAAKRD